MFCKRRASDKYLPVLKHSNICVLLWHFVLALKPRAFINQNGTDVMIMFFHFGLCLPVLSLKGDKLLSFTDTQPYLLEMISSWNFLARAEPRRVWAELSWGTSIFELKPSWQYQQNMYVCQKIANFYLRTTIKSPNFRPVSCDYNQFQGRFYESM